MKDVLNELNEFPHIRDYIEKYWDDPELLAEYLKRLMNDTRDHQRRGFPHEVAEKLIALFNERKRTPTSSLMEEEFRVIIDK